jgi:hypothetical protein
MGRIQALDALALTVCDIFDQLHRADLVGD